MSDTVLAVIPRDRLNQALAVFHRDGFGPVVRVMDPDRSAVGDQLSRAGVPHSRIADACSQQTVVVCVFAPERVKPAAAIAVAQGATEVDIVRRSVAITDQFPGAILDIALDRRQRRVRREVPGLGHDSVPVMAAD